MAAWRDAPYFTAAERAALFTEAVTRLCDRPDPVPDEIWDDVARHYDEPARAALILQIARSTSGTAQRRDQASRRRMGRLSDTGQRGHRYHGATGDRRESSGRQRKEYFMTS